MNNFNSNGSFSQISNGKPILSKVTPKNDIVFKNIFGKKGNEGILKDFLEAILDIKIKSLKLDLSTELLPDFIDERKSVLDVRAELEDGVQVNIEIQQNKDGYSEKRCLRYWSKLYSSSLLKGVEYMEMPKTICIWIIDGSIYNEFEKYESTWKIQETELGTKGHFKELEIHIIELKKFRENDRMMKKSKKAFWLWFIDHTNEELVKMAYSSEEVKKARKELEKITANRELMDLIFRQEMAELDERHLRRVAMERGLEEGREEGREEGIKEGEKNSKKEIAVNMLKMNMDIKVIIELTKLSEEEILELKNNI